MNKQQLKKLPSNIYNKISSNHHRNSLNNSNNLIQI